MADGITITPNGLDAAVRGLAGLRDVDRRGLFKRLGATEHELTYERMKKRIGNKDQTYSASKRAQREGGDTLWDNGHMMPNFRVLSHDADRAVMGFSSAIEEKKAVWAQYGTKKHLIRGKWHNGPLGPFVAAGVGMPSHVKTASGRITKLSKWRGGSGLGVIWRWAVNHPGTPPRPLFGVSPKDATALLERIREFYLAAAKRAGLNVG